MDRARSLGLSLGVLIAAHPAAASGQGASPAVSTLPASVRAVGLGGAGAALVGDASVIFANPAGLATVRRFALEVAYAPTAGGPALSLAAAAVRLGRLDWGFGAQALATGGNLSTGQAIAASALTYRRGLLAFGVTGKYAHGPGMPAAGRWAGDVGMALAVFDLFALGASVQNIGGDSSGGLLPRQVRAGFTMNYVDPEGLFRLLTTLEGDWRAGARAAVVTGVEAGVVVGGVGLVGRAGYSSNPVGPGAPKLGVGGGVELGRFHLDYAYQPLAVGGLAKNRFGVRWTP